MRAIGLTCGIGSMLIGARNAGFKVAGNIEWRRYYHLRDEKARNTFEDNFDAPIFGKIETMTEKEKAPFRNADLAFAHTECGRYSVLSSVSGRSLHDESDIPRLIAMIAELRPRFFVSDNLPGSLVGVPLSAWKKALPDYDVFPEMISNYHYGNVQLHRRRLFLIGALRTEKFVFRPGERDLSITTEDVLGDLVGRLGEVLNHDPHTESGVCKSVRGVPEKDVRYATWKDIKRQMLRSKDGQILHYWTRDGRWAPKIGMRRTYWEKHCDVLTGTNPAIHPKTGLPFSVRERCRVQGFPDDFVIRGVKLDRHGRWNHFENLGIVKQTGKAMPVQWCEYVARQIRRHIEGKKHVSTGLRFCKPHPTVDEAKMQYCKEIGYARQADACGECWMRTTCPISQRREE